MISRKTYGFIIAGLVDAINGIFILAIPYIALHINAGKSGTIANVIGAIVYTLICFFLAKKKIFNNPRYSIIIGLLLFIASCIAFIFKKNIYILLVMPVFQGMSSAFIYPILQTWITEDMDRPQLVKTMGDYTIVWVLGFLLGPSIGGFVLKSSRNIAEGINVLFMFSAIILLMLIPLLIPDVLKQKLKTIPENRIPEIFRAVIPQDKCKLFLYIMWIATFSALFVVGLVRFLFTEFGKVEGLSPFLVGNINSTMYVSLIILIFIIKRYTFWLFSLRYLLFFQIATIPAILLFIFTKNIVCYYTAASIIGCLLGFTFLSSSFYSLSFEGKKDKYININEAMVGAGSIMAGIFGYLFAEYISLQYSFLPGIFIILITIFVEVGIYYRVKKKI
jgi:MFS family permease